MFSPVSSETVPLVAPPRVDRAELCRVAGVVASPRLTVLHCLLLALVAVLVTTSIWKPAPLFGHSSWFDLTRMVEFHAAIRAGDFFPAWSPDFYHGYGSPLFQFYAPFVYYLAEIPVLAGLGLPSALKLTQVLLLLGSGLTMYRLAADHVSPWAACFGAALYLVAPYRFVDLYVRHATAEHAAFLWLPLIVLGTQRFATRGARAGLLIGALATAGLICTHNITALIGLPVCLAAGCFLSAPTLRWATHLRASLPALLGLGLSAFFWWPALSGRGFVQADASLTTGYFDFRQHFVSAAQFLDPAWGFAESGTSARGAMSRQLGWPHLLLGLGGAFLLAGKPRTRWSLAGLALMALAVFMGHAISRPLWETLPLLPYVQFPWRFLGLAVFGAAIAGAALFDRIVSFRPQLQAPACAVGLLILLGAYFPFYSEARFHEHMPLSLEHVVTPAAIRAVGERATSGDDFLPRDVVDRPATPAAAFFRVLGGEIKDWSRPAVNHYRATVTMPAAGTVVLQQFWFPGWTATLDGRARATQPHGRSALVSCAVPAGAHTLEFRYAGPPQRRHAMALSLGALVVLIAALLVWKPWPGTPR